MSSAKTSTWKDIAIIYDGPKVSELFAELIQTNLADLKNLVSISISKTLMGKSEDTLHVIGTPDLSHLFDSPKSKAIFHSIEDLSSPFVYLELSRLSALKRLRLIIWGNSNLGNVPPNVFNIYALQELTINTQQLRSIPSEIGKLRNLKTLNLDQNLLKELPREISQLVNLSHLSVKDNRLLALSKGVGQLPNLVELSLENNKITDIPIEIKNLAKLERLNLVGNPIPIPPEILEKINEPDAIFSAFFGSPRFSQIQKEVKPVLEVKLLFVGQGSVGKTSLVKRVVHDAFDEKQSKTDGISINQWQVKADFETYTRGGKFYQRIFDDPIRLNIWDFGGQEIMHATHQFFLTKRSLYLLVLDSRLTQEENRVEYWLKIIQSFGDESPVLIVGNKIDQHPLDIDRTGLQKKYPNIVGILETSAATGAGIEELKAAIAEQVNNLPHVRDLLPEAWFTVKTKLEGLGRESNFITHDKYLELCAENGITDETSSRTLIGFLHDLGVVLHFQDDPRLEALGILNPQWVTNGVYKILNSHTLFQNKGVLTTPMLDEILNLPAYPRGKRLFIVDMMKKFELCYDIEPDKTFLVPDLLPKDESAIDGRENTLAFQYHYAVLPSSVITRFIVRMNEFIHEKVWRSGVILKDGGNTALVKADTEDRKVFIWVSGDEHKRHDFLSKIRCQFDAIHKTISKLEVKEMVPVPGHPEAEPVDYDLLLQMDHNNVEIYPVLSGGKMIVVKVREMLSGVARQEDRQRGNVTNIYIGGDVKDSTIISGDENEVK